MVEPGAPDKRVRTVRLTDAGRAERELLDRHSDELASSLLAPLSDAQRERLVEAMGVVERLLTAGMVEVGVEDPTEHRGAVLHRVLLRRARPRFDAGFDPSQQHLGRRRRAHRARRPAPGRPTARRADRLRRAEVPRPRARRDQAHVGRRPRRAASGVGRRILAELERRARERGVGSSAWRPTGRCARRSASTAPPGYVEVAGVQRRALRPPLVREAPVGPVTGRRRRPCCASRRWLAA